MNALHCFVSSSSYLIVTVNASQLCYRHPQQQPDLVSKVLRRGTTGACFDGRHRKSTCLSSSPRSSSSSSSLSPHAQLDTSACIGLLVPDDELTLFLPSVGLFTKHASNTTAPPPQPVVDQNVNTTTTTTYTTKGGLFKKHTSPPPPQPVQQQQPLPTTQESHSSGGGGLFRKSTSSKRRMSEDTASSWSFSKCVAIVLFYPPFEASTTANLPFPPLSALLGAIPSTAPVRSYKRLKKPKPPLTLSVPSSSLSPLSLLTLLFERYRPSSAPATPSKRRGRRLSRWRGRRRLRRNRRRRRLGWCVFAFFLRLCCLHSGIRVLMTLRFSRTGQGIEK
jgi:hypothetical protein